MGRPTMIAIGAIGLYTETPLHCGAESATGYVDLPVQRERHTGYPLIPGSTIKGVLRDEMKDDDRLGKDGVRRIFGADSTDENAPSPGIVSFGDGLLVAFPVRSSGAPFHWVTCPFVLERVFRAMGVTEVEVKEPEKGTAWAKSGGEVLLEEIRLDRKPEAGFFADSEESGVVRLLGLLPPQDRGFAYTRRIFPERLLIVRDADFKELVEIGTEVLTRIKLNDLGTTTDIKPERAKELGLPEDADLQGNLFVEEVVPPETLFLCALRAHAEHGPLVEQLETLPVLRVGGDETIGRGLSHLTWVPSGRLEEG